VPHLKVSADAKDMHELLVRVEGGLSLAVDPVSLAAMHARQSRTDIHDKLAQMGRSANVDRQTAAFIQEQFSGAIAQGSVHVASRSRAERTGGSKDGGGSSVLLTPSGSRDSEGGGTSGQGSFGIPATVQLPSPVMVGLSPMKEIQKIQLEGPQQNRRRSSGGGGDSTRKGRSWRDGQSLYADTYQ